MKHHVNETRPERVRDKKDFKAHKILQQIHWFHQIPPKTPQKKKERKKNNPKTN